MLINAFSGVCVTRKIKQRTVNTMNNRGLTLLEMAFAIFVFSVIAVAAMSVFAPTLHAQRQAKEISEINTLLDNIATLMMDDIVSATGIEGGPELPVIVYTTHNVEFSMENIGSDDEPVIIIYRNGVPLIGSGFYRSKTIDAKIGNEDGLVTLTLTLTTIDGFTVSRDYIARPVGLAS